MAQGDILLFKGQFDSIADKIIMWRTRGPYSHVEIDIGNGQSIGALSGGVVKHDTPWNRGIIHVPTSERIIAKRLPRSIAWLTGQLGDEYSWSSIADFAITLVAPRGVLFYRPNTYICSSLAAKFLWLAGYDLPAAELDTQFVSPNDLARALAADFPTLSII